jgi:hypothetical protein
VIGYLKFEANGGIPVNDGALDLGEISSSSLTSYALALLGECYPRDLVL